MDPFRPPSEPSLSPASSEPDPMTASRDPEISGPPLMAAGNQVYQWTTGPPGPSGTAHFYYPVFQQNPGPAAALMGLPRWPPPPPSSGPIPILGPNHIRGPMQGTGYEFRGHGSRPEMARLYGPMPGNFRTPPPVVRRSIMMDPGASLGARECKFCKNNGEPPESYRSHVLRDNFGRLICNVLRSHKCEECGADGDNAHTKNYCPLVKEKKLKMALPVALKRTKHQSDGKIRQHRK